MSKSFLENLVNVFAGSTSGLKDVVDAVPKEPELIDNPYLPKGSPKFHSKANEIVKAIGLPPITGLSGPRIGY